MTAYSSSKWSILYFFFGKLAVHFNSISSRSWKSSFHLRHALPISFSTPWVYGSWSYTMVLYQLINCHPIYKIRMNKINLLKRLTRKKDSPYIFLVSFLNLKIRKIRIFLPLYLRGILYTIRVDYVSYVHYIYSEFQIKFHMV